MQDPLSDEIREVVAMFATWSVVQAKLRRGEEMPPEVFAEYARYTRDGLGQLLITPAERQSVGGDRLETEIARALEGIARQTVTLQ